MSKKKTNAELAAELAALKAAVAALLPLYTDREEVSVVPYAGATNAQIKQAWRDLQAAHH